MNSTLCSSIGFLAHHSSAQDYDLGGELVAMLAVGFFSSAFGVLVEELNDCCSICKAYEPTGSSERCLGVVVAQGLGGGNTCFLKTSNILLDGVDSALNGHVVFTLPNEVLGEATTATVDLPSVPSTSPPPPPPPPSAPKTTKSQQLKHIRNAWVVGATIGVWLMVAISVALSIIQQQPGGFAGGVGLFELHFIT